MAKLLGDPELAERFGVTQRTIRQWRYEGRSLPKGARIGGAWRYREADVEKWFDEQIAAQDEAQEQVS